MRFDEALRRRMEAMTPQEREAVLKSGEVNEQLAVIDGLEFGNGVIEAEIAGTPRTESSRTPAVSSGSRSGSRRTCAATMRSTCVRPTAAPGRSGCVAITPFSTSRTPTGPGRGCGKNAPKVRVIRGSGAPGCGPGSASECAASRPGSSCMGRRSRRWSSMTSRAGRTPVVASPSGSTSAPTPISAT